MPAWPPVTPTFQSYSCLLTILNEASSSDCLLHYMGLACSVGVIGKNSYSMVINSRCCSELHVAALPGPVKGSSAAEYHKGCMLMCRQ